MKSTFEANYYDGSSFQPQKASVTLKPDYWEVSLENGHGFPMKWALHDIKKNEAVTNVPSYNYGNAPRQAIQCAHPDFPQALKTLYPTHRFGVSKSAFMYDTSWKGMLIFTAVLLGLIAFCIFWVLPRGAAYLVGKMPIKTEIELGEKLLKIALEDMQVDSAKTIALNKFAKNIDFKTEYPLDFTVVTSDQLNAFALPGGKIVVFSKMIDQVKTPEALVGLMAHEAAHVEERHSLKSIAKSMSTYAAFSLLFGDMTGVLAVLVDNAKSFVNFSHSRELEHMADVRALKTLDDNQLSQKGMVELFEVMKKESGADLEGMEFMSTHPLTDDRLKYAQEEAAKQNGYRKNEDLEADFRVLK